jgi:hypothetical protein
MPIESIVTDTVTNYKNALGIGQRPSLFRVKIENIPDAPCAAVGATKIEIEKLISTLCHASVMPKERDITATAVKYMGAELKYAGGRGSYGDWTITFRNTEDLLLRRFFEAWASFCVGSKSGTRTAPDAHEAIGYCATLDRNKVPVYEKKMEGLFPTAPPADLALDFATEDISESSVTLAFTELLTIRPS